MSRRTSAWPLLVVAGATVAAGGCGRPAPAPSAPPAPPAEASEAVAVEADAGETPAPPGAADAAAAEVKAWLDRIREAGPEESVERFRDLRPLAADAIDAVGPAGVPALTLALERDPAWHVREFAAFAVGRQGRAALAAVPALLRGLRDENFLVTEACDGSLGTIADTGPEGLAAVAAGLESPEPAIRAGVAEVLGAVGPAAAPTLPRLESLATLDPDASVRRAAGLAAAAIAGSQ